MKKLFASLLLVFSLCVYAQGKTYSSSGKSYASSGKGISVAPRFDTRAANSQLRIESRKAYYREKSTYTTSNGSTGFIKTNDIIRIRNSLPQGKWIARDNRIHHVYRNYLHVYHPVVYNDHFNVFFWLWLLDRSAEQRALWAYHHKNEIDVLRYKELLAKDAQLESKIKALETKGVKVDNGFTPSGTEEDLMYNNSYADSVFNPINSVDILILALVVVFVTLVIVILRRNKDV